MELPVVFCCENNFYAISTPVEYSFAGASIAASSRNGASLPLSGAQIREIAHVPFLAFTDRLELGGGEIHATDNDLEPGGRIAIAQRGSTAIIDGVATEPVDAAIGGLRFD